MELVTPDPMTTDLYSYYVLIISLCAYLAYYFHAGRGRPTVVAREGKLSNFFRKNCPALTEIFYPTVWGFTGRVQTIVRLVLKKRFKLSYVSEFLELPDGGEVVLDWYHSQQSEPHPDTPIMLILPGLTGCSCNNYIVQMVAGIATHGYRCVVFNNRGTCGRKLKTPMTYCASDISDITSVVSHLKARCPAAPLSAVGVSLGGMILFNYVASFKTSPKPTNHNSSFMTSEAPALTSTKVPVPDECPLEACLIISVLWRISESAASLEKPLNWFLFNRNLTQLLCRIVMQNADLLSKHFDIAQVLKSRSVREFDQSLTINMFGFKSVESYYSQASLATKLDKMAVPVLCLAAEDDPFVPFSSLPLKEIADSSHVTMGLTKRGGHIGFVEGLLPQGPNLMDRLAEQFACAVFNNVEELRTCAADCLAT